MSCKDFATCKPSDNGSVKLKQPVTIHVYFTLQKIAIRGDGKSPDQKVIDMQLQAANLVYIFDVIILSVTANKSGRLPVETSFLPLNSSKGGTLKCKP